MKIIYSTNAAAARQNPDFENSLEAVKDDDLKKFVREISIPRHFQFNRQNNLKIGELLFAELEASGYETCFQGECRNVVAFNAAAKTTPAILVGAHYDSIPNCPGADDNASAVAALLVCAKIIAQIAPHVPVCFVAFNCEEDGLVGSTDFVHNYLPQTDLKIAEAHILEMIGYATDEPDSQTMPLKFPIKVPTVGNFLGILGNQNARRTVDHVLAHGKTYLPEFPLIGLKVYLGVEKLFPDLGRSDHLPFWEKQIPALMWTDTSNFRNPHYHRLSDTPDKLNYDFLKRATQLLLLRILNFKL